MANIQNNYLPYFDIYKHITITARQWPGDYYIIRLSSMDQAHFESELS